jgi:outer membrane protein assembly factor BamB
MKRFLRSTLVLASIALVLLRVGSFSGLVRQQAAQAATGDWPTFLFDNTRSGFNGAETTINPSTAPNLKVHWSRHVFSHISAEPVEANGMVYWGSWDGVEHASSLTTGSDVWTINLGTTNDTCGSQPHGVTSTATIATEVIGGVSTPVDYVGGGGNATFYALNANTGAIIWQTQLSSQPGAYIWSSPALYNGSIYEGLSSLMDCPLVQGAVLQLDAVSGAIQHIFNTVPAGCVGGSVWSSPSIDSTLGIVYVSTGNAGKGCATPETMTSALLALSATDLSLVGSWQIPANQLIPDADFGATPTLFSATISGTVHQMVGVINKNGIYYAFDRTNVSAGPLWQMRLGAATPAGLNVSSSSWDGTSLYVAAYKTTINGTTCGGSLSALGPASGAFLWQDCLTTNAQDPVITVPGLAIIGYSTSLLVVDSSTGNILFTFRDRSPGSKFFAPASISNGVLYVGNADGKLYAIGP